MLMIDEDKYVNLDNVKSITVYMYPQGTGQPNVHVSFVGDKPGKPSLTYSTPEKPLRQRLKDKTMKPNSPKQSKGKR